MNEEDGSTDANEKSRSSTMTSQAKGWYLPTAPARNAYLRERAGVARWPATHYRMVAQSSYCFEICLLVVLAPRNNFQEISWAAKRICSRAAVCVCHRSPATKPAEQQAVGVFLCCCSATKPAGMKNNHIVFQSYPNRLLFTIFHGFAFDGSMELEDGPVSHPVIRSATL